MGRVGKRKKMQHDRHGGGIPGCISDHVLQNKLVTLLLSTVNIFPFSKIRGGGGGTVFSLSTRAESLLRPHGPNTYLNALRPTSLSPRLFLNALLTQDPRALAFSTLFFSSSPASCATDRRDALVLLVAPHSLFHPQLLRLLIRAEMSPSAVVQVIPPSWI